MVQIQFSLIEKIKIGRPEHSLTPQPPPSGNISILPYLPPKVDVICVSPNGGDHHQISLLALKRI